MRKETKLEYYILNDFGLLIRDDPFIPDEYDNSITGLPEFSICFVYPSEMQLELKTIIASERNKF